LPLTDSAMAVEEQAAAALKAAATASSGAQERHDSLVQTRKKPLRTILDALEACTSEYKSDRFWADLAKPIDKAIEKLREEETALAAGDQETAAEARKIVMMCMEHHEDQMRQAEGANLFINESKMIKMVYEALKFDSQLRLDSTLDSFAQATHAMQAGGAQERQYHEKKNRERLEKVKAAMKPYVFEHTADHTEMTVKVRVPPATAAKDVKCHFTRDTIRVCVAGHALQPAVIDGKLQHPIDADACDWHLEGKGDARELVIDLEKRSGGLDWQDLVQVGGSAGQVI